MSVTGSNWKASKLIDAIDGLDEGAIEDTTNGLQEQIDAGQQRIDELSAQLQTIIDGANEVAGTLNDVQTRLNELIGAATQTGAYVHFIGLDGRVNNNTEFVTQVETALFDTSDPNRPNFEGTSGSVAGLILLVGAPNPVALRTELYRLGGVIPELGLAVGRTVADTVTGAIEIGGDLVDLARSTYDSAKSLTQFELPAARDVADIFGRQVSNNTGRNARNRWYALRLSDLMPLFDPTVASDGSNFSVGAVAGSLLNTASSVSNTLLGAVSRVDSVANNIERIQAELRDITIAVNRLQRDLDDLQNNAANTGVYTHYIGTDFSLHSNRQYLNAVAAAMSDQSDPNTPLFVGDTAYVAGIVFFIGAPNPGALAVELKRFKAIFKEK